MPDRQTIDERIEAARQRIQRYSPVEAAAAQRAGAVLVDTRDSADRVAEGAIPDSVWHPRNVLEWRLDIKCPDRLSQVSGYEQRIIIVCNEGYASSLAAAELHEIGLFNTTDLSGGFQAWLVAHRETD